MNKFKVGEQVLVSGEKVTIIEVNKALSAPYYVVNEIGTTWCCVPSELTPVIETLSNSQLWKLAEDGVIAYDDKFKYVGERHFRCDYIQYDGDGFYSYNDGELDSVAEFSKDDKWIQLPSKPRLTREQAEQEFNITIID
jgi:hypothetical protein